MAKSKRPTDVVVSASGRTVEALPASPIKGYGVVKKITSNLISLNHNPELCVRVTGEIVHQDSEMSSQPGGKPMALCEVTDLTTGEVGFLIVPTVLESALKRVGGGYIGKSFLIHKAPPLPGKRYMNVDVYELEGYGPGRAASAPGVGG